MSVIDELYGKNVAKQATEILSTLELTHKQIIEISKTQIDFFGGKSATNPKELTDSIKKYENAQKALEVQINKNIALEAKYQTALNNTTKSAKQLEAQSLKESNARNALNAQREKSISNLTKEESKLASAGNAYNRLQAELNKLNFAYQNLAVRQAQGATLTRAEAERMDYLRGRIQMHDKTLKAVDASMGKYTRNVGNYSVAFNPLNNSINQLGREMPAFANSVQTGFMAISNNLPIFFDAMSQVIAQNKQLQAEGKPTQSVLKQLAGSLFSFQTLLSVGVTLLTVYGKEIVNWISNLGNANEKLIEMIRLQDDLDNSRRKSTVKITNDIKEYERALSIITDKKQKKDYRLQEIKDLRTIYYYYLKDISDSDLLEQKNIETKKKVANAFNEIKKAITAQEKASETNNILKQNEERLLKLKEEEKLRIKELSDLDVLNNKLENRKNLLYENNQGSLYTSGNDSVTNSILKQIKAIEQDRKTRLKKYEEQKDILLADKDSFNITNEIFALETRLQQLRQIALNNTNASIGLRIKENKEREKKAKDLKTISDLEISQADFLAKEFELRKTILENGIKNNEEVYKNEKATLDERVNAYSLFMALKEQLILAEYEEEKRLLNQNYKDQKDSINSAYNDQIKQINEGVKNGGAKRRQAEQEKNRALTSLDKQFFFDKQITEAEYNQKAKDLRTKWAEDEQIALIDKLEKLETINKLSLKKLNDLKNRNFDGSTLNKDTELAVFKLYKESKAKIEEDFRVQSLENDKKAIEDKLIQLGLAGKTESEEYKKLTAEKINLELQLQEVKDTNLQKENDRLEDFKKMLDETYKGFFSDFANNSGFGKMLDIFNGGLEKFKGDSVASALAISEAFQEAFNTISQASQQKYDAEYERLEKEKQISLKFAGDSATAKEELERQYDVKKKAIQRKEFKSKQQLAKANVLMDTAQAIVALWKSPGFPTAIPMAIMVGALGAYQLATISAQKPPEYYTGTDNAKEGWAWTQERGAEIIADKSGKIKSFGNNKGAEMTYLNAGDKVFNAQKTAEMMFNTELSSMLNSNGIVYNNETNFNTLKLENKIEDLTNIIANKESLTIIRDRKGERIYSKKANQTTQLVNNRLEIKSYEI